MSENVMSIPRVSKVTVHMSVGESGKKLSNAEMIMTKITGQKPVRTFAKRTLPGFNIKKGEPIGCKVTLRCRHCGEVSEYRARHHEQVHRCQQVRRDR